MSNFVHLRDAVEDNLKKMGTGGLFFMNVDKDEMWNTYLDSFPEGTNNVFRERREYDCTCCRQFIKTVGHVVTIKGGKVTSIWDGIPEIGYYGPVVDAMSKFVKSAKVGGVFFHDVATVGARSTIEYNSDGVSWDHFVGVVPSTSILRRDSIASTTGSLTTLRGVFSRALKELRLADVDIVLELIDQNSLYRGAEYIGVLKEFRKHKIAAAKAKDIDLYAWEHFQNIGATASIRNTAIGTLLVDLGNDMDLESAVRRFESMVAPANYKRPTALVTSRMIDDAKKTIAQLGIENSLPRRFAVPEDITVNNLLFVDRTSTVLKGKGVFDVMKEEAKATKRPKAGKIQEVSLDDFLNKVLPTAEAVEVLFERAHQSNMMSLIAPVHADSPNILKWDNNFSWSYVGEMADSVKERVKAAGGRTDGKLRVSLGWSNRDDLDIHVVEPGGNRIYYGDRKSRVSDGSLDVDMHISGPYREDPVENIIWPNNPKSGKYRIEVNNFTRRDNTKTGYRLEVECNGELFVVESASSPRDGARDSYTFEYSQSEGVKVGKEFASDSRPGEPVWGIRPNTFVPVDMVMFSPNHWDDNATGNKHVFFMIKGCINHDSVRGFYNEFLKEDLNKHRKVFEILASKMKPEHSDEQLSGFGFSTTARKEITVKVTGAHERILKVKI